MKEKKKKEEDISSEIPRKKRPSGGGRLSDMVESMQKRGNPLKAHRVATRYFDSFRREREIPEEAADDKPAADNSTVTDAGAVMITAVDSAVIKRDKKRRPHPAEPVIKSAGLKDLDDSFTPSESRVYGAIYSKSIEKKTPTLRLGLTELRELTGLSDKTVRVAVHSLEKKLALRVVESSLGVYGRKFRILTPEDVLKERHKAGMEIDPTTKKVLSGDIPVSTMVATGVDNALHTAITTAVITAVEIDRAALEEKVGTVSSLYELYTGNKWGEKESSYWEKIKHLDPRIIETALVLSALKGKGGVSGLSDLDGVLGDLGPEPQEGYLEHLREVWNSINERGEGRK